MLLSQLKVERNGVGDLVITMPIDYAQELLDMVEDFDLEGYAGADTRDYRGLREELPAKMRAADPLRTWIS